VPFVLFDPRGEWTTRDANGESIAAVGTTLLELLGLPCPADWLPSLATRRV
jgi:hypothetical protein